MLMKALISHFFKTHFIIRSKQAGQRITQPEPKTGSSRSNEAHDSAAQMHEASVSPVN